MTTIFHNTYTQLMPGIRYLKDSHLRLSPSKNTLFVSMKANEKMHLQ